MKTMSFGEAAQKLTKFKKTVKKDKVIEEYADLLKSHSIKLIKEENNIPDVRIVEISTLPNNMGIIFETYNFEGFAHQEFEEYKKDCIIPAIENEETPYLATIHRNDAKNFRPTPKMQNEITSILMATEDAAEKTVCASTKLRNAAEEFQSNFADVKVKTPSFSQTLKNICNLKFGRIFAAQSYKF